MTNQENSFGTDPLNQISEPDATALATREAAGQKLSRALINQQAEFCCCYSREVEAVLEKVRRLFLDIVIQRYLSSNFDITTDVDQDAVVHASLKRALLAQMIIYKLDHPEASNLEVGIIVARSMALYPDKNQKTSEGGEGV